MRTVSHPPSRTVAAAAALIAAVAIGPIAAPAPSAAAGGTALAAVTDGNARFQVLTPTLIRTEYAGDGVFADATTFNAVNRSFPTAAYTTSVTADGYREIKTSALTLRYKQNSGPFTAANLSVVIAATGATAHPAFPSYCAVSTVCEAENALLPGYASTGYDHTGFTGSGFAAGFETTGSGIQYDVDVPAAGSWRLAVRYANAVGSD